jgi:hypothetical protein
MAASCSTTLSSTLGAKKNKLTNIKWEKTIYLKPLLSSINITYNGEAKHITYHCILKAHSHSKSGGSIGDSLECQCSFWIAGGLVSYLTMWLLTLQLFKNSIDTQGELRLNLHSLSVSELLEYRRKSIVYSYYFHTISIVWKLQLGQKKYMWVSGFPTLPSFWTSKSRP